jgi:hypothetical protein
MAKQRTRRTTKSGNEMNQSDQHNWSEELLQLLVQRANATANPLERDDYEQAIEALKAWQQNGGPQPGIIEKYRHLLPTADGVSLANEAIETGDALSIVGSGNGRAPDALPVDADLDEPPLDDPENQIGDLETPTQKNARRELDKAHSLLDKGLEGDDDALKQIIGLTKQLLQQPEVMAEAQKLHGQAQEKLNQLIAEAVKQGDAANESGNLEAAREFYERAKALDSQNQDVLERLADLSRQAAAELSDEEMQSLRVSLKNRRDLQKLEAAVYQAEMLDLEGRLTAELVSLLQEARKHFDQARQSMGQQTTMMRFGDLRARQKARDEIESRLIDGQETMWDSTTDTYRRTVDVLEEAEIRWQEGSEDTAQYELARLERALPAHPRWAQERLQRVLANEVDSETGEAVIDPRRNEPQAVYPFFTQHRRLLEQKQEEIERLIQQQDEAEKLSHQANQDKENALQLLLRAFTVFPYAAGLREWLKREQQTAINGFLDQARSSHRQALQALRDENYASAFEALNAANRAETQAQTAQDDYETSYRTLLRDSRIPTEWLDEDRWRQVSQQLADSSKESDRIRKEIEAQQRLFREYEVHAKEVRKQLQDPGARAAAIKRFDDRIESNQQFHTFEDYLRLRDELVQYRDVGDNLGRARLARNNREWKRLRQLTQAMLELTVSGALRDEIKQLAAEARQELLIQQLRQQLRHNDPQSASNSLTELLESDLDEESEEALRKRLQPEIEAIETAQNNTAPLQPLYDQAVSLSGSSHTADQLQALHIFRYLGGDQTESRQEDWPEHKLSMLTREAHEKAIALRQTIREATIDQLLTAYQHAQENQKAGEAPPAQMADLGRGLRDARLLDNEAEREAARFFIIAHASAAAREKEDIENWQEAVDIWRSLDQQYPGSVDVHLRRARIHHAVSEADLLLRQNKPDAALDVLRAAQNAPDMAQAWQLEMKMADVFAELAHVALSKPPAEETARNQEAEDYFRQALTCLSVAERHEEGRETANQRKRNLEKERFIGEAHYKAEAARHTDPKFALTVLQNALRDELGVDSDRLKRLRAAIFAELSAQKLGHANEKKNSGDAASKIAAVMALVDLREIEEIAEVDQLQKQADKQLAPLKNDLAPSAKAVIDEAEQFRPQYGLGEALKRARELDGRLQVFTEIQTLFDDVELERLNDSLANIQREIGALVSRLENLEALLADANDPQLWRQAVITGNFRPLEEKQAQIEALRFKEISEVEKFIGQLAEWKKVYDHLKKAVDEIRYDFVYKDLFKEIYLKIRKLSARAGLPFSLQHVDNDAFHLIRNSLEGQLIIHDLHGNEFAGWQQVEQAAEERHSETEAWQEWADEWGRLNGAVRTAQELCDNHNPGTPLNVKRENWRRFIEAANEALAVMRARPEKHNLPLQPYTRTSEKLVELAQQQEKLVTERLRQIELETQRDHRQFPSGDEWAGAKTVRELERVIRDAKEIGPSTDEERQRMDHYEKVVLPKLKAKRDQKGFLDRIFRR